MCHPTSDNILTLSQVCVVELVGEVEAEGVEEAVVPEQVKAGSWRTRRT